jgi:hypothetical protein
LSILWIVMSPTIKNAARRRPGVVPEPATLR